MGKSGIVYICHHVDTEGPLWENLEELFKRLELVFDINVEPTTENLLKLQNGDFEIPEEKKIELLSAIDPHSISFKKDWSSIEQMLMNILTKEYRNTLVDSFGSGWVYNWHIMDHVGFGPDNPRHRIYGYHNVFDFYTNILKVTNSFEDRIHWHFHPIPFYKQANIPATSYDNSISVIHQIICRRIIDKSWFPTVNRAGFHTERIDANLFLEQWLPFDPSNQSVDEEHLPKFQSDLIEGRYGDWRGAPSDWSLYNPSLYDWRKHGELNRVVARVLNMKSRHRSITESEIEKAFLKARNGENVYLGITNHDWREMSTEINEFRSMLENVSIRYSDVKYKFADSISAFRAVLNYTQVEIVQNELNFTTELTNNILRVEVLNGSFFGPQPYLALKTINGDYFHDNFDFGRDENSFSYTFDNYTLPISQVECIAVASNDKFGNFKIVKIKPN